MRVVPIPNGVFVENTYLVIDEETGQCAVVDPGEDAELISRTLQTAGVTAVAIWLTHAHLDHVLGVSRVREETGAPVYLRPSKGPRSEFPRRGWRRPTGRSPTATSCTSASSPSPCDTSRVTRPATWRSWATERCLPAMCCSRGPSGEPTSRAVISTR